MKKIVVAVLLSTVVAAPAFAADKSTGSVGVNLSVDGVVGVQGEFSLAEAVKQPVSVQVFLKNWSSYNSSWDVSGFGVAGIYDFSALVKQEHKIHPYVGVGLISVQNSWHGLGVVGASPVGSGLYLTGGVKYDLTPQLNLDGNWNTFGGLTVGVNLLF
jgi:hypothetical protein